jgi:hypothetical protein
VSTQTHQIKFVPNALQRAFIESRARADLFSSRMGEGKSAALAWSAFFHAKHNPGSTFALIRDTWENLRATTQKEFFKWFPPGIMGSYHATNKEFTWAPGVAEGTVIFLGMDAPDDATKLMSRALAGFGMDEPAPAIGSVGIDEMIFDIAMSRLRENPDTTKWYAAKLAENNPDEAHWTYKKFVNPGTEGFRIWQPAAPENLANLPVGYYAELKKLWQHRPDLVRRFVEGEFGFQQIGKPVTPQWSDKVHLSIGLTPVPRQELAILWDFGHNPTSIVTQKTQLGHWNILEAIVGEGIGTVELIESFVRPIMASRYRGHTLLHIGDPTGRTGDQSSSLQSPVRAILKMLGGTWRDGPVKPIHRIPALEAVLSRTIQGKGLVQVDRERAAAVWHALRGGWHYHVARTGLVSAIGHKDVHSHPGDAMSYGAAVLFPLGRLGAKPTLVQATEEATYFSGQARPRAVVGSGVPGQVLPPHGTPLPRQVGP